MRGVDRLLLLTGILCVMCSVSASLPANAGAKSCPGAFHGGFFHDLAVRKVNCAAGRHVLQTWVRRSGFGTGRSATRAHFGGWTCRLVRATNGENPAGRVTCTSAGRRRVRFYGTS
jgi:hypothetical protein